MLRILLLYAFRFLVLLLLPAFAFYLWAEIDPYYVLDDNSTTTGYMITDDDVEVFITKAVGTYGGRLTTAWVLTEETSLYVNMYGEFSRDEVEEILNSLEIAKILKDK